MTEDSLIMSRFNISVIRAPKSEKLFNLLSYSQECISLEV